MANRRKIYGETGETGDGPKPCPSCGCRQRETQGDEVICRFCGQIVARNPTERAENAPETAENA